MISIQIDSLLSRIPLPENFEVLHDDSLRSFSTSEGIIPTSDWELKGLILLE